MAFADSIFRDIQNIQSRLRKLEGVKQLIGADIVQIVSSGLSIASSGSIASGLGVIFTNTLTPASEILTLWDLFFSFYIDTNNNSNFLYPNGASLSTGQKNLQLQWSYDYLTSDDSIGKRVAKIIIVNKDSSAHEYFMNTKWYGINETI